MLRLRSPSKLTAATAVVWGAFATAVALRPWGAAVSERVGVSIAGAAAVLALSCAVRAVGAIWRGPRVVSFAHDEAVLCPPAVSDVIRRAAQLRGTMGGAGHVFRWRLLVRAIAWSAASALALSMAVEHDRGALVWPVLALLVSSGATVFLPARAFYYREVNGGSVLVSPSSTPHRLGIGAAEGRVVSDVLPVG